MHELNRHRAFVDVFCRCFALNKCGVVSIWVELARWWVVQTIGGCSHSRGRVLFPGFQLTLVRNKIPRK